MCVHALTTFSYEAVLRHTDKDTIEMIYDRFLSVFGNYSRPSEPEFEAVRQQASAVRKKRLAAYQACKANGSAADCEKLMFSNELFEETADHYAGCAAHHMDKIAVTLLWIHARDDPVRCSRQHSPCSNSLWQCVSLFSLSGVFAG